ncbi:MAG: sigma-54-dependent Fis family transcriptional regulator, partial [Gammaproteobacteria bacterium]|nr:sigma-54-dependent Fis family transcriptional regulator [Gammaproteobacteria bacterium]
MEVFLPPLRERGADVIELARFLVEKTCKRLNRQTLKLPRLTLDAIKGYGWPGNIRELENAIERAVILADSNEVTVENLAIDDSGTETAAVNGVADLSMDEYFQHFVRENQSGMTETELAKRLGISRKALWERRQRLGIPRQRKST